MWWVKLGAPTNFLSLSTWQTSKDVNKTTTRCVLLVTDSSQARNAEFLMRTTYMYKCSLPQDDLQIIYLPPSLTPPFPFPFPIPHSPIPHSYRTLACILKSGALISKTQCLPFLSSPEYQFLSVYACQQSKNVLIMQANGWLLMFDHQDYCQWRHL